MEKPYPLYVSLTTIPSRLVHIRPAINSLLAQTMMPDRIILVLPMTCDREPGGYDIPSWLSDYGHRVSLARPTKDCGPGSKLLGALPLLREPTCLILVDDDMAYHERFLASLYAAQIADLKASYSFYVHSWGAIKAIGQGVDGFSFFSPNLHGIEQWAERVIQVPELRVHDDLWISAFLQRQGVAIKNIRDCVADLGPTHDCKVHEMNQLQDLQGNLARSRVLERGVHHLVSRGYLGRWLQFDHHARMWIKRLIGRQSAAV
jgi:hypothetical protein